MRKVTHVQSPGAAPSPVQTADLAELLGKINDWSSGIRTMVGTVDLEPKAGSVYSGVIKEYHDVKGFILFEKPEKLRMVGQAPVVRTTIFDMVSTGDEFRLNLPTKQKFIVGKTNSKVATKNTLENLRPQHILQALIVPPVTGEERTFLEDVDDPAQAKRYYVVSIVQELSGGKLVLKRKVWFDRSDLDLTRVQTYDSEGACTEDVTYSNYQDFGGVRYPWLIGLTRPHDDYALALTIEKATFNQPLAPEKFELKKPEGSELLDLDAPGKGNSVGQ